MSADVAILEKMLAPLSEGMTEAYARRLTSIQGDEQLADELDRLSARESAGTITEEERRCYDTYVHAGSLISVLQAQARLFLKQAAA